MRRKSALILYIFLSHLFYYGSAQGSLKRVPQDFSSIQEAINAAINGDTVLVASGIYRENINFHGKNIVVTSYFAMAGDKSYINNTVIDGSEPVNADSASCVLIISGEDSTAVLQGFTLTGGKGTRWLDEHGAGTYVEGGAILVTESSPTIQYNLIVNNEAISSPEGTTSAGGGAIRCGDSSPRIYNNVILNNKGMYGAGIVLNYCSDARISNNIINGNEVYQAVSGRPTFGGGGLWLLEALPGNDLPNIISNNTITGNISNTIGSGIRIWDASAIVRNNIIWYNIQSDGAQISRSSTNTVLEYNNIQNESEGTGNISLRPSFADSSFLLNDDSPCIDSGDPAVWFNDPENGFVAGSALWPSKGTTRNDMGAYGGPRSFLLNDFSSSRLYLSNFDQNFLPTYPGESDILKFTVYNIGSSELQIDSLALASDNSDIFILGNYPLAIAPFEEGSISLGWAPQVMEELSDTLFVYSNEKYQAGFNKIFLTGTSFPGAWPAFDESDTDLGELSADLPVFDTTLYIYNYGTAADSVFLHIDYERVRPDSAMRVIPEAVEIGPKDSAVVNVLIFPSYIRRSAFTNQYKPTLVVESAFSITQKRFLKQLRFELGEITDIEAYGEHPEKFTLLQNFPNPFNPITHIRYSVKVNGSLPRHVDLSIYNLLGQKVATLVDRKQAAGNYNVLWDASGFASGIYYLIFRSGDFYRMKKMLLVK